MKIAFTSCMSTTVFPEQPVWDHIKAQQPDHLLLTGDSIYIDTPPYAVHPKTMSDDAFMQHVHGRYTALLAQPQFAALVKSVPTEAIWDDHDFLWNEAYAEQAVAKKIYAGHVRASRALFNAYCRSLRAKLAAGSFPALYNDALLWKKDEPAPAYRCKELGAGVALHLTDGRSQRRQSTLLGSGQRQAIAAKMASLPPDTVHLLASGSVVEAHKGDHWGGFEDYAWLLALAQQYRILVLSGDIHENAFNAIALPGGQFLFEATASGAAICLLVNLLSPRQNYGLLDVTPDQLQVSLFSFGQLNHGKVWRVDRAKWRLV
jgi:alkaline phosphatase D